jgi:hypothetical protein
MMAKVDPLYDTDYQFEILALFRIFLKKNSGIELNTMGEFQILLGVVIGFQMIIRLGADKLQKILTVLGETQEP